MTDQRILDRLNALQLTRDAGAEMILEQELARLGADPAEIEAAKHANPLNKPMTRYDRLQALQTALDAVQDNLDTARALLKDSDTAELNELAVLTDRVSELESHIETELEVLA